MRPAHLTIILAALSFRTAGAAPPPDGRAEAGAATVRYLGSLEPAKELYDGGLPHAVGVHHFQAMRADRSRPPEGGTGGWTYNHQPYLAYWRGRFYLQYVSAQYQEHTPPTRTMLITSADGGHWTPPSIVFPEYPLPRIDRGSTHIAAGTIAVMHQRMGFYTAPNGKLLTVAFYGYAATPRNSPNAGNGLGRVVREITADGSFGPIYFIRYNRHAGFDEGNTAFPFYLTSSDAALVAACDSLLADKLYTLQWWEEDRGRDGFFAINPGEVAGAADFSANVVSSQGPGKAFAWYTRADGAVVGLWKNQYTSLSRDRGRTWLPIGRNPQLRDVGAKTWGQRTADGRYAIVGDQSANGKNRFPLVVLTGADGHDYDSLYCLQPEVAPRRYQGQFKNSGPQYFRGIEEGNGTPPGQHLWIVYSMNKEDIWVSRGAVPVRGKETAPLRESFESAPAETALARWNLYTPQWAPVEVVAEPDSPNHVLQLTDRDPSDYAVAERVFPSSRQVTIRFRVQARSVAQGCALEVEVQSQRGARPMRLRLDGSWLGFDHASRVVDPVPASVGRWHAVELQLDCERQSYTARVDGGAGRTVPFQVKTPALERIVFRTGPFRGWVPAGSVEHGEDQPGGLDAEDMPGVDQPAALSRYWIDDLETLSPTLP